MGTRVRLRPKNRGLSERPTTTVQGSKNTCTQEGELVLEGAGGGHSRKDWGRCLEGGKKHVMRKVKGNRGGILRYERDERVVKRTVGEPGIGASEGIMSTKVIGQRGQPRDIKMGDRRRVRFHTARVNCMSTWRNSRQCQAEILEKKAEGAKSKQGK